MTQPEQIISKEKIRRAFNRAADSYDRAAVLQKEVCKRLLEKLEYVRIDPEQVLDAGVGTGEAIKPLMQMYRRSNVIALDISEQMLAKAHAQGSWMRKPGIVCADIENLPFKENTFDLVFSSLTLQWCNDLEQTMKGLLRVLKPGGLLMLSTFGPDTLKELRDCWKQVDDAVHVNSFTDMHDVGDVMMSAGFADPVMEAETITVNYRSVDVLMNDLRDIGANVTAQGGREGLTAPAALTKLRNAYEKFRTGDDLPASYEIIYGHAWKSVLSDSETIEQRVDIRELTKG